MRTSSVPHRVQATQADAHCPWLLSFCDPVPEQPGQSRALIATLLADDPIEAEAAAARLAILGRASVRNLLRALPDAQPAHAVRLLGVLERIADPLALPALVTTVMDVRVEVAQAAVAALAPLLVSPRVPIATAALDRLTALTLDATRPAAVRVAALDALATLDLEAVALVRAQLLADPDADVRAAARGEAPRDDAPSPRSTAATAPETMAEAVAGRLPADPDALRRALAAAEDVSPGDLLKLVQRLREEERRTTDVSGWRTARAAVHQALAARGSRLAVYDLRETLAELGPATPVGILSALRVVGDVAALDVIVDRWEPAGDEWFTGHLADAFAAIVRRDGLTRRHGVIRKLAQRAPAAVQALWPTAGAAS